MGSGPTQTRMCKAHFCALKVKYGVYKEVWGRAKEELLSLSATKRFLQTVVARASHYLDVVWLS